jgi:hypothetical protein
MTHPTPDDLDEATLAQLLRAAWPARRGCDHAAALLDRAVHGGVDPAEVEAHLATCVVCRALPEHAEALLADPATLDAQRPELDRIAAALDARLAPLLNATPASNVVALPRRPAPSRWLPVASALAMAAAAVLAVGIGLQPRPPALPAAWVDGVARGAALHATAPVDDLDAAPTELVWSPLPDASVRYAVRLERADGAALWSTEVTTSPARLPDDVRAQLAPATRYHWRVDARRGDQVVATTDTVAFRIAP